MYTMGHMETEPAMVLHAFIADEDIVTCKADHYLVIIQQHNHAMYSARRPIVANVDVARADVKVVALIIRV